jgi:hypothetical protein
MLMRSIVATFSLAAMILTTPQPVLGKIATLRTAILEVHAPGTEKGEKFGAVTLSWGPEGAKPEVRIVKLTGYTEMTALGKDGRAPIGLKDLKPGMTVVTEMSASRIGDTSWKLDALHVLDTAKPPDPALIKLLSSLRTSFIGSVAKAGPPAAERKEQVGQVELKRGQDVFIFYITKDTEIVRQGADGKQQPASFDELKGKREVAVIYPGPLATGNPPEAPATRVIILDPMK